MTLSSIPRVARCAKPIAALLIAAALSASAMAQRPEPSPREADTPSADEVRQTIENVFGRIWTPRSRFTDGPHNRRLFRPVIADAREATVQIRCGGKRVAYGSVVGPDGWVLTKASQLRGAVTVRLPGGDAYPARIVGVDRDYDLAMLKIEAAGLSTLDLQPGVGAGSAMLVRAEREKPDTQDAGDDSTTTEQESPGTVAVASILQAGNWVATVGYGRDPVAIGVVSVLPREIDRRRGLLGIRMAVDEEQAEGEPSGGVRIDRVFDETGASRAGLEAGDTILSIDGDAVSTNSDVAEAIRAHYPGDEVVLAIRRGGERLELRAVLTGEVRDFGISRSQYQNSLGGKLSNRRFGFPVAMQHDTVLAPEDCGGPIVDIDGRVVGFNIARAGRTETYALPTEAVRERLYDLMSGRLAPPSATDKPIAAPGEAD